MVLPRVQAIVLAMIVIGVVGATFATESTAGSVTNASSVPQFTVMVNVVVNDVVCVNALLLVLVLSVVSVSVLAKLFIPRFVLLIVRVPSVWIKTSSNSS
jgi:tetrahydromethanopterin S-methyltransferase subunit E